MADLMARLAREVEGIDGVVVAESAFKDDVAYWVNGSEIAHFDGEAEFDIRLTRAVIRELRQELSDNGVTARARSSDWVCVAVETDSDVELAVALVRRAAQAHRPPPGVTAKPPPTGSALAHRKRFH